MEDLLKNYWILHLGSAVSCIVLGTITDWFLYKQKPNRWATIIPLIIGPLCFYFLAKSLYYGLKR